MEKETSANKSGWEKKMNKKLRKLSEKELKNVRGGKQPPGQLGYEGQPGNQGGHNQAGPKGYEGQPGNQSHN
jgi:hypothetical protein